MTAEPDSSAVRTALWRALHVHIDPPPHLLTDEIGVALAAPPDDWRERRDMDPIGTAPYRIGIVARTRFVEDLLIDARIGQYVLVGAGLDTFAQRHPELASQVRVFEVDQPGTQAWKRHRLEQLGYGVAEHLRLVPVDFETDGDWWPALVEAGFDPGRPALVSSSGVSMYITKQATIATLRHLAVMAPGSMTAMTFMLPADHVEQADRPGLEDAKNGAQASGTPWVSFYTPDEIVDLATRAGFGDARYVNTSVLADRYLEGRTDGVRASSGEGLLLARVTNPAG